METEDIEFSDPQQPQPQQPFQAQAQSQGQPNLDVLQGLLQQFNCLGTTDHEELVQQMLQILGFELTYTAAKFFLDMNNWNLQGAVGCYLDAYNNQRLPSMQIVADVTTGLGESITPNTSYRQAWKIQNSGEEAWPEGCYLKVLSINEENVDTLACLNHIQASNNNLPDFQRINLVESAVSVPALRPGNSTICSVVLHSSGHNVGGSFQAKFRLCTQNGNFFGDTLWSVVPVMEAGTLALTQQVHNLHTSMSSEGLQVVEANNEFVFNRPVNSPEAQMIDQTQPVVLGGPQTTTTTTESGGGAMDADLIPTNFIN